MAKWRSRRRQRNLLRNGVDSLNKRKQQQQQQQQQQSKQQHQELIKRNKRQKDVATASVFPILNTHHENFVFEVSSKKSSRSRCYPRPISWRALQKKKYFESSLCLDPRLAYLRNQDLERWVLTAGGSLIYPYLTVRLESLDNFFVLAPADCIPNSRLCCKRTCVPSFQQHHLCVDIEQVRCFGNKKATFHFGYCINKAVLMEKCRDVPSL